MFTNVISASKWRNSEYGFHVQTPHSTEKRHVARSQGRPALALSQGASLLDQTLPIRRLPAAPEPPDWQTHGRQQQEEQGEKGGGVAVCVRCGDTVDGRDELNSTDHLRGGRQAYHTYSKALLQ